MSLPSPPRKSIRDILRKGTNGINVNFPREAYSAIAAINPSSLADGLCGSSVDVTAIRSSFERTYSKSSDGMDRGTLAHMVLLQPERLEFDVAIWTGERRAGNAWKDFESENKGKLIIRQADYDYVLNVMKRWEDHKRVRELLQGTTPETAVFTTEKVSFVNDLGDEFTTNVACKGQIDALGDKVIVDIKTTEVGIDRGSVHSTIRKFKYREKMAMYRRWAAAETKTNPLEWRCYNLFVSLGGKPGIHVVELTEDALAYGEHRMLAALSELVSAIDRNKWPPHFEESEIGMEDWESLGDEEEIVIEYDE